MNTTKPHFALSRIYDPGDVAHHRDALQHHHLRHAADVASAEMTTDSRVP